MPTYTSTTIAGLSTTTPTEGSSPPSEINNAIREIKTVLKNQTAYDADTATTINAAVTQSVISCDATAGAVTVNLPAVATAGEGKVYIIKKSDAGANKVTVDASTTETIDGELTYELASQYAYVVLYCNGTSWDVIGNTISDTTIAPATGTKMLFYQDTAPTGWTIDTAVNDKLVFITKGSTAGGQTGGTAHSTGTWTFSGLSGNTDYYTLTVTDIPAHSHYHRHSGATYSTPNDSATWAFGGAGSGPGTAYVSYDNTSAGGGGAHRHALTSISHSGNWRPAAYNCIICSKN